MMEVGDKVVDSPVGCGQITDFSERGFPKVNHVAVAWLQLEDGRVFDPWDARKQNLDQKQEKG